MTTNLNPNDNIKMVIFDLDETFWNGTLSSEEKIEIIPYNVELVKKLVDRGIMCSISSKNDFDKAKSELVKLGIWDLFIFPAINWDAKGPQIKNIIDIAQLRDENILFVDDNHLNLEEAKFYCKNIKVAMPDVLTQLLSFEGFKGKDDSAHSRLNQYKILEVKQQEKSNFSDNKSFLESSMIQVNCTSITENDLDRVLELILRTNQLNFTKKRIDLDTLKELLNNSNLECKSIYVNDRFGDYGMVGFYCLNKPEAKLEHFIFSCRIMNLGVEQWIYTKLNFPQIDIVEPVSASLNTIDCPDYINKNTNQDTGKRMNKKLKVLLLGNCDMQAMAHYVMGISKDILANFYIDVSPKTHMQVRYDSIWKMKNAVNLSDEDKDYLLSVHKWLDESSFRNRAIYDEYDVLVFSVLNDYMVPTYLDKKTQNILTPTTSYVTDIFSATVDEVLEEFKTHRIINFGREDIERYQANLTKLDYMTPEQFRENLEWLVQNIKKPIVFLNGPEIHHPKDPIEKQQRFIALNKVLDDFVDTHGNCYLLDVRKYIKTLDDTTDILTHYKRETYMSLAEDLFGVFQSSDIGGMKVSNLKLRIFGNYFSGTVLPSVFSVKNEYRVNGKKYKIIRIFGVKIKIRVNHNKLTV